VLLLPEVLSKPLRDGDAEAVRSLSELLVMIDLRPVDQLTAVTASLKEIDVTFPAGLPGPETAA
jgi:hypothetical protein